MGNLCSSNKLILRKPRYDLIVIYFDMQDSHLSLCPYFPILTLLSNFLLKSVLPLLYYHLATLFWKEVQIALSLLFLYKSMLPCLHLFLRLLLFRLLILETLRATRARLVALLEPRRTSLVATRCFVNLENHAYLV